MYLGRPDTDGNRCLAIEKLGNALRGSRPEEALPVLEANLALRRRYWPHAEQAVLAAQANAACCLDDLGRFDEALVLKREIYARRVATMGVSHERTILSGNNLVASLEQEMLWNEAKTFLCDELLPATRRMLGDDHNTTLVIRRNLGDVLRGDPESTRDHLRLNTARRRRPVFDVNTGDDLLEAETILHDVVQRRRRVFGPAHPETRQVESTLSLVREGLDKVDST